MRNRRHASGPASSSWTAAAIVVLLLGLSCGGKNDVTPPTTLPSAAPTSAPPAAAGYTCALGAGSVDAGCEEDFPKLERPIDIAIDLVVNEKPQLFDKSIQSPAGTDQYKVLDGEAYLNAVTDAVRRQGLCAERDPDDLGMRRVLVKQSNDASEAFRVLSGSGFLVRASGAYETTCTPSSFPVVRTADMPPAGSGCGRPYPPPISRFNCKVHMHTVEYDTMDSTPIIGPNLAYCQSVGFVGRTLCPVRGEGAPDREACENWLVGVAKDTGRPGPYWTNDANQPCTGPASKCANHPDNQYAAIAYASGKYRVTAANGATCEVTVER